jgi:hypothetical protein
MLFIESSWDKYVSAVYPTGIDPLSVQYTECRRAFYAGNASMMGIVNSASNEPDEFAMKMLQDIRSELKDFSAAVKNGEK